MADAPMQSNVVDQSSDKLREQVQQILSQVLKPKMSMGEPTPRYSEQQMKSDNAYNMEQGHSPKQEAGIALQNFGVLTQNLGAMHKQKQVRDALADWQGFDNALQKAQMGAGDPNAPDYQQKVQQGLAEMPWVKAMLDPSNPKSVKRLKNMHKALNPNVFDEKEDVYGAALKQHMKGKDAEKQMQQRQQQLEQLKQQTVQNRMQSIMQQMRMVPPDPKQLESTARIIEAQIGREEALEFRKQAHNDALDMQKQNLEFRRDNLNERMQDRQLTRDAMAQYHKESMDIRRSMLKILAEKAAINNDVSGWHDAIAGGAAITLVPIAQRKAVVESFTKNGERVPTPINPQEMKTLESAEEQVSKIGAWQAKLKEVGTEANGQLSNKPFGQTWDRLKYWVGMDTPQGALISDFSRERWAAIAGLVQGVRRGDILRDMVSHTPDPFKDSPALMNVKMEALDANWKLARAVIYQEHGFSKDPVTGSEIADDIASYTQHLHLAAQEEQKIQMQDFSQYKVK